MIVLAIHDDERRCGTVDIADGDFVTPQRMIALGYSFPFTVMRYTFKDGPYVSPTNGAPLVQVEWSDSWPDDMKRRVSSHRADQEKAFKKLGIRYA
jgi:hypothetical protein